MENYQFTPKVKKLLSCNPSGSFTFIDKQLLQQLIDECTEEVVGETNGAIKCRKIMRVADICYKSKCYHTALDLYRLVINTSIDDKYYSGTFRCQMSAYAAASKIDAIWTVIAPTEKRASEYAKMVYFYMACYDDYRYVHLNEDNEYRFNRINEYARRNQLSAADINSIYEA